MSTSFRGVVVGASTLLGKELIEQLNTSGDAVWDLRIADTADATGQLVPSGDEPLIVQPLTPHIFDARDIAFFTAGPQTTTAHWAEALAAGAAVIDLTAALESEPGAIVRSPWIAERPAPQTTTAIVIPAHPAAVILGIVASRLATSFRRVHLAATVLEPASQQGKKGLDELHQQTVNLLGFHSLPQEVYDAQVAFSLRIGLGEAAKLDLSEITSTIHRHLKAIAGESIASSIALQLVQAPVFHGYTMSVYAQFADKVSVAAVRRALGAGIVHVTNPREEAPSNQSIVEEPNIAIALTEEPPAQHHVYGIWLWMAADNLKFAARHVAACAEELASLRALKPQ